MSHFNWLHITDLHYGQPDQEYLWSNVREAFFEDLRKLHERTGPWNAVFFTGDLVFSGEQTEYDKLESEVLTRIWDELRQLGSGDAILLAVPGNHDLIRPNNNSQPDAALRQLLRDGGFDEIAKEFWKEPNGEYSSVVQNAFQTYKRWWNKALYRNVETLVDGILPGDFAATLLLPDKRIGVLGLNSTFLQLAPGNFQGRLVLDPRQVFAVCPDVGDWAEKHDACILLTHQGPAWLTNAARDDFREINPAGRFAVHLYGHMHENLLTASSEGGGPISVAWQSASLFGMEKFGEPPTIIRQHGYAVGRLTFSPDQTTVRCWPRIAIRDSSGWRCHADHARARLENDEGTASMAFRNTPAKRIDTNTSSEQLEETGVLEADVTEQVISIEAPLAISTLQKRIKTVPRCRLIAEGQHRAIRKEEQAQFEYFLRSKRVVVVVADWGLGKDGFLGVCLERLSPKESAVDVYRLRCEDAETVEQLLSAAASQFGISFQEFCALAVPLASPILILDEVGAALIEGPINGSFNRFIQSILDYCPNLSVVIVVRHVPDNYTPDVVALNPLDTPDVRTYLSNHSKDRGDFDQGDEWERIQRWSDGLPMHLDRLLDLLEFGTLTAILEDEGETAGTILELGEPVPRALREAVDTLAKAGDPISRRSFKMLKVLTVLAEGETLTSVKHFYPTEPFQFVNAKELSSLSLLGSSSETAFYSDLATARGRQLSRVETPKVLRVPRQVRDLVRSLITESEKSDIIHTSTELMFGRRWREGKIHLRTDRPSLSESANPELGNEHIVIRYLLAEALKRGIAQQVRRIARLGIGYCAQLKSRDRFRDLAITSGELVHLLEGSDYLPEFLEAASLYGTSLRMSSRQEEAIRIMEKALEHDESMNTDMKLSLHLNLALAHESEGHQAESVAAAKNVLELTPKDSASALQAEAVIAEATESGIELRKHLISLEQIARDKRYFVTANNIALVLARKEKDWKQSLRYQEKVLSGREDLYNRTRAVIDKVELLTQNNSISKLTTRDRTLLGAAYAYSYGQRMTGLFDRCHTVIWGLLTRENLLGQLIRLFRHSSFWWRIKGDERKESKYLHELDTVDVTAFRDSGLEIEIQYLLRRRDNSGGQGAKRDE